MNPRYRKQCLRQITIAMKARTNDFCDPHSITAVTWMHLLRQAFARLPN